MTASGGLGGDRGAGGANAPRTALSEPGVPRNEDYRVFTPERVSLQFDIAGIGSRAAAALIDTTIQALIGLAVLILNIFLSVMSFRFEELAWVTAAVIILGALAVFFLLWGYYVIFEILWSGQTPGKRALGIRVIRGNGYPIRVSDAVVRNLIRILDGPPFGAPLGSLVMLFNDRAKRIGDYAAGTIVVREGKRQRLDQLAHLPGVPARPTGPGVAPSPTPGASVEAGQAAMLPSLSAEDATLVRDFLVRRGEMRSDSRDALARRLTEHLCRRYGLPDPARGRAESFLESLVAG